MQSVEEYRQGHYQSVMHHSSAILLGMDRGTVTMDEAVRTSERRCAALAEELRKAGCKEPPNLGSKATDFCVALSDEAPTAVSTGTFRTPTADKMIDMTVSVMSECFLDLFEFTMFHAACSFRPS